jgi:hypothetical protein
MHGDGAVQFPVIISIKRNGEDITHLTPGGLGDKIAAIAQPVARVIDKIAGTKIAGCGGCRKMKDRLNAGMPVAEALKLRIKGL